MKPRKQNNKKIESPKRVFFRWTLTAFFMFLTAESSVSAAQARLVSASAAVHETADGNSGAVGNLVQGNTFELHESVTTEAGETWYLITMSNGIQGYIRGEISEENGEGAAEADNPPAQPPEEVPADTPLDNVPEEGADAEGDAAEGEILDGAEGALDEEGMPLEEGGETVILPRVMENIRQKTYAAGDTADRVKAQIQADTVPEVKKSQEQKHLRMDKTLILLLVAAIGSAGALCYCHKRVKQQLSSITKPETRKKKKSKRQKKREQRKRQKSGKTTV